MKIRAEDEFDVFRLFVHDIGVEANSFFDEAALAEALTEALETDTYPPYRIEAPDDTGLDRFVLRRLEDRGWTERYYSVEQVKEALPDEVVRALEELNKSSFKLQLSERRYELK
jgi:hypothetical protein